VLSFTPTLGQSRVATTKAFDSKTLQEAWSGRKPNVSHLKVFGCKPFAHVLDEKRTKLESKSMPCVFLGYYEGTKVYRLMCVKTKRIIKSRDVVFIERLKKIGGVPHHPEKEENVVVREEVEVKEPLTFSRDTLLNERRMEGVQSESTPKSSSEEEFIISNDNPSSEPSQMCRGKDLKGNEGNGLGIGGLLLRRWSASRLCFWRSPKILRKH
jgi:hypothetical protein